MNAPLDNEKAPRLGPGGDDAASSINQNHHGSDLGNNIPDGGGAGNGNSLVPDTEGALAFLENWRPGGPWVLTSIVPDGKTTTATFAADKADDLRAWLNERQRVENVYFSVNDPARPLSSKAKKADIAFARALHVDIDPRVSEDVEAERQRAEHLLRNFDPPPTVIIDSGGGYQGFWLLVEPEPLNGDPAPVEGRNLAIEVALGADACHNIDRIMRLPGTINVPGEKKRKKGRVPAPARVVEADWSRRYRLDDFTPAPKVATADGRPAPKVEVTAAPAADVDLEALPISDRLRALIVQGGDPDDPARWADRSKAVWHVTCELVRAGIKDDLILGILLHPDLGISAHVRGQPRPEPYARRQVERVREEVGPAVWPPLVGGPMDWAHVYRTMDRFLVYHADEWLRWDGHAYRTLTEGEVRAAVWKFLDASKRPPKDEGEQPPSFCPRKGDVDGMLDALKALAELDRRITEPCWLDGRTLPDPLSVVVCRNGLLDLATGNLLPPSPAFFARSGLAFDYDPDCPKPVAWLRFLSEVWPGDEGAECIAALRRFLGYLLTPDTRYQKALMIVGPTRSGKGVIGRVIAALVGNDYAAAPTLNDFGGSFPLADLLGARVAVISDLRLGRSADESMVAEALLRVTGEDRVTVGRKYKGGVTTTLAVRFVVMSNELPRWGDKSGALAHRFIVLPMTVSFLGNEDETLTARLLAEVPGILRWAMEGWRQNREAGALAHPEAGRDMVADMKDLASPVAAFVRERCDLGPDECVGKDLLFRAFRVWHEDVLGQPYRGNSATFARDLYAATGGKVGAAKMRDGGTRVPSFAGIGFAASAVVEDDEPPF